MEQLAAKTRRRDLVFDSYQMRQHYFENIPDSCFDTASLRKTLKDDPELDKLLRLDAQEMSAEDSRANQFPDNVQIGSMALPVQYRFEPGQKSDGATIQIPEKGLSQLDDNTAGWLIPGMFESRIVALIKSLPSRSVATLFQLLKRQNGWPK